MLFLKRVDLFLKNIPSEDAFYWLCFGTHPGMLSEYWYSIVLSTSLLERSISQWGLVRCSRNLHVASRNVGLSISPPSSLGSTETK
jgi:hypothetical protein